MATTQAGKIFGLCKEVTLAVLPRLHLEELLLELGRRNVLVGENYKKESLVSKLWFIMVKEYHNQGTCMVHSSVMPNNTPSINTGPSCTEQRNMWATLSNDLQELMETVTPTNSAANTVPVTPTTTQTNGAQNTTSSANVGSTGTPLTSAVISTNPTPTQPLTSVTLASPPHLPVSIFTQEVVVETTAEAGSAKSPVTSPRRSARLHILETQEAEASSCASNLGEVVETYQPSEENPAIKEGRGKGRRTLRAMAVTRSDSCNVDSNTVVIDLRAIRGLEDDPNAAEDEEEDEASSDEEDDVPLDYDDADWQPDTPMEHRQLNSSSKRKSSGIDSSSSYAATSEETAAAPTDNRPPRRQQKILPREPNEETDRCRSTPPELQTQRSGMSIERRRFCRQLRSSISNNKVTSSSGNGFRIVVDEVSTSFPHIIRGDIEVEVRRVLRTKRYEVKRSRRRRGAAQEPED